MFTSVPMSIPPLFTVFLQKSVGGAFFCFLCMYAILRAHRFTIPVETALVPCPCITRACSLDSVTLASLESNYLTFYLSAFSMFANKEHPKFWTCAVIFGFIFFPRACEPDCFLTNFRGFGNAKLYFFHYINYVSKIHTFKHSTEIDVFIICIGGTHALYL